MLKQNKEKQHTQLLNSWQMKALETMLNQKDPHKGKLESTLYYLEFDFQQEAKIGWDFLSLREAVNVFYVYEKK